MEIMPENEAILMIHRYLSEQMELSEKQEFEQRLKDDSALSSLKQEIAIVWNTSLRHQAPEFDSKRSHATFERFVRRNVAMRRIWRMSVAAAMVLLVISAGLYYVLGEGKEEMHELAATSQINHLLEDGSEIALQAGALVRLPESFGRSEREMEIVYGEVYFDIASDPQRPFIISHPWGEVKVVGTAFSISIDTLSHRYQLLVTEGTVTFQPQLSKQDIPVTAGTGLSFDIDTRIVDPIRTLDENQLSWYTGVLRFVDAKINKVVADLSRHYGVHIEVTNPEIEDCLFTAPLPYQDVEIAVILDALSTTIGASIRQLDSGHYQITGGACR